MPLLTISQVNIQASGSLASPLLKADKWSSAAQSYRLGPSMQSQYTLRTTTLDSDFQNEVEIHDYFPFANHHFVLLDGERKHRIFNKPSEAKALFKKEPLTI